MTVRFGSLWWCGLAVSLCSINAGCEVLHNSGVPGLRKYADSGKPLREEEKHRDRYQVDRDSEAMRWLLANRITTGMTVSEVGHMLGEDGEREHNDNRFKTGGGYLRLNDRVYRWGPDNEGNSVYLGFRDDRLVNFNPEEFARQ